MSAAQRIKKGLVKVGKQVCLADAEWTSMPFFAVIAQKWRSNRSNFEFTETELGRVSADYFTYIGPCDHDIFSVSESGRLICGDDEYIFKKKEKVVVGGETLFYWGILRRIWSDGDD